MKLTKYQHACLVLEKESEKIVIDPGAFSHDFIVPHSVVAIVITHEHPDHLDESKITALLAANPKAIIIAHESIVGRFTQYQTQTAKPDEPFQVGPFSLRFFGGVHETIAEGIPVPPNYGVLVDERLYYPGDSFVVPEGVTVKELAVPASAPWLKLSESMRFLSTVKPSFAFPTHDAILSDDGKALVDRLLATVAASQNTKYSRLDGTEITLS